MTQGWFAAVYLGSDLLVFLVAKAARRDSLYWVPNAGIPLSLLFRFGSKVLTDSTGCVDLRHPLELGGLYYTLNAALGQVPPIRVKRALYSSASAQLRAATTQVAALGSVALHTAYYVGEAKVATITLYAVVGTLAAVWAITFGAMLLTMDRKYVRTFFSTQTGRGFVKL